jgi:hypothetical protein
LLSFPFEAEQQSQESWRETGEKATRSAILFGISSTSTAISARDLPYKRPNSVSLSFKLCSFYYLHPVTSLKSSDKPQLRAVRVSLLKMKSVRFSEVGTARLPGLYGRHIKHFVRKFPPVAEGKQRK